MFREAYSFNGNISNWDVSNGEDLVSESDLDIVGRRLPLFFAAYFWWCILHWSLHLLFQRVTIF